MPQFVFDEEGVDILANRFLIGGDGAEDLAAIVDRRVDEIRSLRAVQLNGFGPSGQVLSDDYEVASALRGADIDTDSLVAASRSLTSVAGVWREAAAQLATRVADIQAATITTDDLAAGDLLADIRAERPEDLLRISGASVRGVIPDLPPPGDDPELDAVITRFDSALLPGLLSGNLVAADLSEQERRDLQRITDLLGGDDVVAFTEERLDFVEVAGEDQPVRTLVDVSVSDADPRFQVAFVRNALATQGAANALAAASGDGSTGADDINVSTISGEGGREGGQSQSSVQGEVSFGGGAAISTEVVDLGGGLQEVTVSDPTTGTQFSGLRTETDDGFAVAGDITFSDGTTGTVDVFASGDKVEVDIRSDDLGADGTVLSGDLNRTNPGTGFGLLDTFSRVFENFSLFGSDEVPFDDGDDGQRDSGEPNGGQVPGADPGVGRNDLPGDF